MKKELNKVILGIVTLLTAVSFAQTQQQPESSSVAMTEEELVQLSDQLSRDHQNACVVELLKGKKSSQIIKVNDNYDAYLTLEGNAQDWQKATKVCKLEDSYFEILVNMNNQKGVNLYRMRFHSYLNISQKYFTFRFFSPFMPLSDMVRFVEEQRQNYPVKGVDMGKLRVQSSFQKVIVKAEGGKEIILDSIERRLSERTDDCLKYVENSKQTECSESASYSVKLNWVYNEFVSYDVIEGIDRQKFNSGYTRIVSVGREKIEPINDIRDIFSEVDLLASLKQDWIIRNSNQWTRFAKAKSWNEFWNFITEEYSGPASKFQSYSNRLDQQGISKVRQCAQLAGSNTTTNSGYECVRSSNGPRVYMFNYKVFDETLKTFFVIKKVVDNLIYVTIPLSAESTGSAFLQIALPRKNTDYFKSLK